METNYLLRHRESERAYHQIVDDFIVRLDLYERAKFELETREQGDSYHHFIYVGNRGSGKSTLLERIRYEIDENDQLSNKYITIDFADETRDIYKLYDLWSKIILQLAEQGFSIEEPAFSDYEDSMDEYSRESILRINALLEKEEKTLVLFIDNIDRLFKNIKSDKSQLREVLLNYQNLRIFGGSTTMSESFWNYGEAFYEFFTIVQLEDLTKDEIYKLISHWTKKQGNPKLQKAIDQNPGKIEAIRIMTGGNPRMMISFMRMLLDNTLETGYDYLRMLIDDATMGYQEKLNFLSGQKAKIFSELAYLYESAQVEQLVQPCKMTSKTISSVLNALIKDNYVEKIRTNNKNHLYRVKERFFNIWIIMTQSSPLVRQKAKYLTDFLELFYSEKDIVSFFQNWKSKIASKGFSADKAIIQAKALYHSRYINLDDQLEIYNTVSAIDNVGLSVSSIFPEALKSVLKVARSLAEKNNVEEAEKLLLNSISNSDKCKYIYAELGYIFREKNKSKSIEYLLEAKERGDINAINNLGILYEEEEEIKKAEKYYLEAIEKGDISALYNLGLLYVDINQKGKAEKYYLEAIEAGNVSALNNLGVLYSEINEKEKAEQYYLEAIEKGDINSFNNLAVLYKEGGEIEKAEQYYLEAIEKGHVSALSNLGALYADIYEKEKAEQYYLEAIEKGDINSFNNLAILYKEEGDIKKSEQYYLEAKERGDVSAINNLGTLYADINEKEKAEQYYLEAIEKGDVDSLYNLAVLYKGEGAIRKAEQYYLEAIEKGDVKSLYNLAILYKDEGEIKKAEKYYLEAIEKGDVKSLNNLAILYKEEGAIKKAEHYYLEAIEKGHTGALNNLADIYYTENKKLREALKLLRKYLTKDGKSISGKMLENIISLVVGNSQEYLDSRDEILERELELNSDNKGYLETYFIQLLIHNQEEWIISLFEGKKYGQKLKGKHLVLYYTAIQMLNSKDVRLNNRPPELGVPVMDLVDLIVERRKVDYN